MCAKPAETAKPHDTVPLLQAARAVSPDGGEPVVLGAGQFCVAVRVGAEVVRFPRHAFGVSRLRNDVAALTAVGGRLGARVPDVLESHLDAPAGRAFVRHTYIEGEVLTAPAARSLPSDVVAAIAALFADLHALGPQTSLPSRTHEQFADELEASVRDLLFVRMSARARSRALRELGGLRALPTSRLTLCHTDGGGNLVHDAASGRVGLIDFGSAMNADPALDAASLLALDERLAEACFGALDGARVIRRTFALQDAMYGAQQDDWDHVDGVLSCYADATG